MAEEIRGEMVANIFQVLTTVGSTVQAGEPVVVLETMKMEIPVLAERGGIVREIAVAEGDVIQEGDLIAVIE